MVNEIEANLCFCFFGKNWKIQNGRQFWGEENFLDNLWVENFDKITLSRMVKRLEEITVFAFLEQIRKFKMAAIFVGRKIFENCQKYIT